MKKDGLPRKHCVLNLLLKLAGADPGKLLELPSIVGLITVPQDLGGLRLGIDPRSGRGKQFKRILKPGLPAQLLGSDPNLTGHNLL